MSNSFNSNLNGYQSDELDDVESIHDRSSLPSILTPQILGNPLHRTNSTASFVSTENNSESGRSTPTQNNQVTIYQQNISLPNNHTDFDSAFDDIFEEVKLHTSSEINSEYEDDSSEEDTELDKNTALDKNNETTKREKEQKQIVNQIFLNGNVPIAEAQNIQKPKNNMVIEIVNENDEVIENISGKVINENSDEAELIKNLNQTLSRSSTFNSTTNLNSNVLNPSSRAIVTYDYFNQAVTDSKTTLSTIEYKFGQIEGNLKSINNDLKNKFPAFIKTLNELTKNTRDLYGTPIDDVSGEMNKRNRMFDNVCYCIQLFISTLNDSSKLANETFDFYFSYITKLHAMLLALKELESELASSNANRQLFKNKKNLLNLRYVQANDLIIKFLAMHGINTNAEHGKFRKSFEVAKSKIFAPSDKDILGYPAKLDALTTSLTNAVNIVTNLKSLEAITFEPIRGRDIKTNSNYINLQFHRHQIVEHSANYAYELLKKPKVVATDFNEHLITTNTILTTARDAIKDNSNEGIKTAQQAASKLQAKLKKPLEGHSSTWKKVASVFSIFVGAVLVLASTGLLPFTGGLSTLGIAGGSALVSAGLAGFYVANQQKALEQSITNLSNDVQTPPRVYEKSKQIKSCEFGIANYDPCFFADKAPAKKRGVSKKFVAESSKETPASMPRNTN